MTTTVSLNSQELAAVLGALRTLQEVRNANHGDEPTDAIETILTDNETGVALSQEEIDALCERINLNAPINVVIALEGGIVTGGCADVAGINVTVLDYDTEGADEDELVEIPQHRTDEDGDVVDAYVTSFDVDLEPDWVAAVLSAIANS